LVCSCFGSHEFIEWSATDSANSPALCTSAMQSAMQSAICNLHVNCMLQLHALLTGIGNAGWPRNQLETSHAIISCSRRAAPLHQRAGD
jgi:hypothetical protein